MLSCKEASALVSSGMDRKLPLMQRIGLWLHLIMCKHCRHYRKQLRIIRDIARQYEERWQRTSTPDRLSREAVDRITKAVKAHPY